MSISLIALILLSLLSYQTMMLKSIEQSHYKLIATQQLLNFSEILLIAKTNAQKSAYLTAWNRDNKNLLPQGVGAFSLKDNHICEINLRWVFLKAEILSEDVFC